MNAFETRGMTAAKIFVGLLTHTVLERSFALGARQHIYTAIAEHKHLLQLLFFKNCSLTIETISLNGARA